MNTTITTLPDPHGFLPDPLTDILRASARDFIQRAVAAELSKLLEAHSGDGMSDGALNVPFIRPMGD